MKEERRFWRNEQFNLGLMHATHVDYAYPRHSHEEYVICLVERGLQSFTMKGTKYVTPPSGLILINPSVVHTGEAATEYGFQMRSLYPSMAHMQSAVFELTGKHGSIPFFRNVRVDDVDATQSVFALHQLLTSRNDPLECESQFLSTFALLIKRYAEIRPVEQRLGNEHHAVQQARCYIETHYAERISLTDLANHVALSPYYFLRVFRKAVGLPPHAYLQDVRIRQAQRLIERGRPLTDVAFDVGFSSQSHLTRCFKRFVGVTPGRYAGEFRPK